MAVRKVADGVFVVSASDKRIEYFENLFPVPDGAAYNSYVVTDEKTAVLDGADAAVASEFLEGVGKALGGRPLDYIVINHLEPDHSAALGCLIARYPEATLVGNAKTKAMAAIYLDADRVAKMQVVAEGETLSLGKRALSFVMTPMVHWPESMVAYDATDGILFAQDAFGAFGSVDGCVFDDEADFGEKYIDEMRRYYANIVGKYGAQVAAVLKKVAALDVKTICPIHGLIIRKHIAEAVELYSKWSGYAPEKRGVVIAYASMYGNTKRAAFELAARLAERGVKEIVVRDLSRTDVSYVVADAFKYSHMALASVSYNGGLYPKTEALLADFKALNVQNRAFSLIENGSWAPCAARQMKEKLDALKAVRYVGETLTVRGSVLDEAALDALAATIAADVKA